MQVTKKLYATYTEVEARRIRYCEICGSKRDLCFVHYSDVVSIECDNCQHGKGLWKTNRSNHSNRLNKKQVEVIEKIIEQALSEPDKEIAVYKAKSLLKKMM